jgi:hypothetical protein
MGSLAYEKVLGRILRNLPSLDWVVVVPEAAAAGWAIDAEGFAVLPTSVGSGWQ